MIALDGVAGGIWGTGVNTEPAGSNPFVDYASRAIPTNIRTALEQCEFIFMANGLYREATRRLIAYFITDIQFGRGPQEVKDLWNKFFTETLDYRQLFHIVGLDLKCFHGDTLTTTRNGVFKLRDLVGKTVDVLSSGGKYRPATFKAFGRQKLLEVEFSDGRTVLATPEHEWVVANNSRQGGTRIVPTTKLAGKRVPRVVAQRPERNEDFYEGVRHGFVFGDGTRNGGSRSAAYFHGSKDEAMLSYFTGHGNPPRTQRNGSIRIGGLPSRYKSLPDNENSASLWYGFVCGLFAADGSVDTHGCPILTQKSQEVLEAVAAQLPRIGMIARPVRVQVRAASFPHHRGGPDYTYDSEICRMGLCRPFMSADDLLLPAHKTAFAAHPQGSGYSQYTRVKSVTDTGRVEEVFCCVEPETHTFVVENGILTGNCYGNSFISVIPTFNRNLMCGSCRRLMVPYREAKRNPQEFRLQWQNFEFTMTCPKCHQRGVATIIDQQSSNHDGFRIRRWSPHDIEIHHCPWTDTCHYTWKIPEDYRQQIKSGEPSIVLEHVPKEVISAVKNGNWLTFDPGFIFHMRECALAGVNNRGWGISQVLTNFRQAWYCQVLHRYNEAIAMDYVIPFRVITPEKGDAKSGMDMLANMNAGGTMAQVHSMIRKRRSNPMGWYSLPFPIKYQALGGDARALAPVDLMKDGNETLLNNIGIPVEIFKGSMTLQAAPIGLRLFEASHSQIPHSYNGLLRFIMNRAATMLRWPTIPSYLKRVQHADNVDRQMAALNLMTQGAVSPSTGLGSIGIDHREEIDKKMDDMQYEAEKQQQQDEMMQRSQAMKGMMQPPQPVDPNQPQQQGGQAMPAPPGGGAPPQQGAGSPAPAPGAQGGLFSPGSVVASVQQPPGTPVTVEQQQQSADIFVQAVYAPGVTEGQRQSELMLLKRVDPNLHAIVRARMNDINQKARTQGKDIVLAQMFGKTGNARITATKRRLRRLAEPLD